MKRIIAYLDHWLGERLPVAEVKEFAKHQAAKLLPTHTSWFHTFGSLSLYLVVNQVVTGILLMIYYRATPETAFESVRFITARAAFGWLLRGLHAWGATLMLLMLICHMMRTFFMGAFKKPRELTWVIGVLLFFLTMTFGFTGYLLPWNQLSFWATTIGTEIAGSIPLIGEFVRRVLLGGDSISGETLSRFYVLHVVVLPWILVALVAVHLVLMRTQGLATLDPVGQEQKPEAEEAIPFFPHHVVKEMVVFSLFVACMITIVIVLPPELGEKADPFSTPQGIKPEWYFLPTYQLLKYFPKLLGLLISVVPSLLLLLWPFLDRTPERKYSKRPVSTKIGILAILLALIFGMLGHLSERTVTAFGKQYHFNHYGVPAPVTGEQPKTEE